MSPSHTLKKGIRYRYYVSQALEQRRKGEAGAVARAPAPDVEALVGGLVANRVGTLGTAPSRHVLEAHVYKVTVHVDTLEVALRPAEASDNLDSSPYRPPEIVHLPWASKPFIAAKGVAHSPSGLAAVDPKARDTALVAIGKARLWVDELLTGGSFSQIAKREGKGERQIRLLLPLAFVPPATVRGLIDGAPAPTTITELAKSVPIAWSQVKFVDHQ
jgi:hypothetical protein